ncbi:MAG: hypothetical protein J6A54_03630 [Clostridia bacterium]|nr:hypothetical protein [Clostridia bacterium]
MKNFVKVFLFFSGFALSVAGACALFYKFFKKHCIIHIEFNPAEENTCECGCEEGVCEECACEECEASVDDLEELEFTETENN